jgi:hypothetical protein
MGFLFSSQEKTVATYNVSSDAWVSAYTLTGASVGEALSVCNRSAFPLLVLISATQPADSDTTGSVVPAGQDLNIDSTLQGVWLRMARFSGPVGINLGDSVSGLSRFPTTQRTRLEELTVNGDVFRCQARGTALATASSFYSVEIPANRIISTVGRNVTTEYTNIELNVYAGATGIVSGTPFVNRNNNGRSTKTTSVVIAPVTSYTTIGTMVDTVHYHGANKTDGGEYPSNSFRIYTPGTYLVELKNLNTGPTDYIVEYTWADVPELRFL